MSKEGGRGAGFAPASVSIGGSLGGVGFAERSGLSTGFSSRAVMSSVRAAEPRLATRRVERPSLSLSKANRPSVSMRGTSFESSKNITGKTRGITFATTENFAKPSIAVSDKAKMKIRSNGIEVSSIMPQTNNSPTLRGDRTVFSLDSLQPFNPSLKAESKDFIILKNLSTSVPVSIEKAAKSKTSAIEKFDVIPQVRSEVPLTDLKPFTPSVPESSPEKLVTQQQLDQSVPLVVSGAAEAVVKPNVQQKQEQKAATVSKRVVIKENLVNAEPVKVVPEVRKQEEATVPVTVQETPQIKVIPKVSPVVIGERSSQKEDTSESEQKAEKQTSTVTVHTDGLAALALLAIESEKDEEKKNKQDQIEKAAQAYVRAGVARDFGEGVRMTERFLRIDPIVLVKNQLQVEQIQQSDEDAPQKPAAPEPVPSAQPIGIVASESKAEVTQGTRASAELIVSAGAESSKKPEIQLIDPGNLNNNTENQNRVHVTLDETKKESQREPDPEVSFKVDEIAQRNREQELNEAVRQVFPAFDIDARVPLSEVANILKPPSAPTNSGLIYQIGKKTDGSNDSDGDWRTPLLTSDAMVTAAQARIAGMWEIYTKPPVVMKNHGRNVTRKDVDLVLSGDDTKRDFALAA